MDIASQGATEQEALENLREALELYWELPIAPTKPQGEEYVSMDDEAQLALIRTGHGLTHEAVKARFKGLYEQLVVILQEHDPIGIAELPNEYGPEAVTILLRLKEIDSLADLRRIIHEEFIWWFSNSQAASWEERLANNDAGPEEKYAPIAADVWDVLQNYRMKQSGNGE